MMIDKQKLLDILTSEIESSTGCTDPGSVCLAVAVAAHPLGRRPEKIDVLVSPNIYKNGVSVGIPGTNRIGLELAAALGLSRVTVSRLLGSFSKQKLVKTGYGTITVLNRKRLGELE